MKRYRVLTLDFDTRVLNLKDPMDDSEDHVKELHDENRKRTEEELIVEYGQDLAEIKKNNFLDLGVKPISIVAFHNKFFEQVRNSFVVGSYYPALTSACALGERILNHLVLRVRDDYMTTPEYKRVYNKDSFDNWAEAIETLLSWNVLLNHAAEYFSELATMRHNSIHFRPETDHNDRELALEAILCLQRIIGSQFSAREAPWFITSVPGEIYIKKEWEEKPFIKRVYLPNCFYVGPKHIIKALAPKMEVNDDFSYQEKEITDDEFVTLRKAARGDR